MKEIKINVETLLYQVKEDLKMAETFQGYMENTVQSFTAVPFLSKADDLVNGLRHNQHYRDIYLERVAAALQVIGYFDENKGHTVDFECLKNLVLTMEIMMKEE